MKDQGPLIWDLPLRLFHWLLALSFGASWASAELRNNTDYGIDFMLVHMWLGYWMAGLLIFRIGWGFWGPTHARFTSFLRGPSAIGRYLQGLFQPAYQPTAGHNPLGGLAVLAMLSLLVFQVFTGLFTTDDLMFAGPWVPAVSSSLSRRLSGLHESNFDWLVVLVALHLLAIGWYWWRRKANLVLPMITGRAGTDMSHTPIGSQRLLLALLTALGAAAGVWAIINFAPEPAVLYQF